MAKNERESARFGKFTAAEVEAGTNAGTGRGNAKLHASSGITEDTVVHGQIVKRAYPLDTSDMTLPNEHGMDGFRGGPTNLSTHSLDGSSAVMGPHDGNESPYIPNH